MTDIDREGTFRAQIIEYGLQDAKDSQAVSVAVKAKITEAWNFDTKSWEDWSGYDVEASGAVWIIKKDGELHKGQIEALCRCCGWDGNIGSIVKNEWHPEPCQIVVTKDEYKQNVRYRISFLNEFDRVPGEVRTMDATKAKVIHDKYASQLRAIAGNVKRNAKPSNGSAPPPPPPSRVEQPASIYSAEPRSGEEIPF